MFTDIEEFAAYSVTERRSNSPRKSQTPYSPRHERPRQKSAALSTGAHRRRQKRNYL
jgi:hypothetical protein